MSIETQFCIQEYSEPHTSLGHSMRAESYGSLVPFYKEHGECGAAAMLSLELISKELFRELYYQDTKNLNYFDLVSLKGRVQKSILEVPSYTVEHPTEEELDKKLNEDLKSDRLWRYSKENLEELAMLSSLASDAFTALKSAYNKLIDLSQRIVLVSSESLQALVKSSIRLDTSFIRYHGPFTESQKAKQETLISGVEESLSESSKQALGVIEEWEEDLKDLQEDLLESSLEVVFSKAMQEILKGKNVDADALYLKYQKRFNMLEDSKNALVEKLSFREQDLVQFRHKALYLLFAIQQEDNEIPQDIKRLERFLGLKNPEHLENFFSFLKLDYTASSEEILKRINELENLCPNKWDQQIIHDFFNHYRSIAKTEALLESAKILDYVKTQKENKRDAHLNHMLLGRTFVPSKGSGAEKELKSAYRKKMRLLHPDKLRLSAIFDSSLQDAFSILEGFHRLFKLKSEY